MIESKIIELSKDCEVVQIPGGNKLKLPQGTMVSVTQSLGGCYTLMTDEGFLVRLDGKDADAIGLPVVQSEKTSFGVQEEASMEKRVWDQLKTCYDPEIPIDIVELGLIYDCQVIPLSEGGSLVQIKMTLTAPGCGMGSIICEDVRSRISDIPGVKEVQVELVLDPPWNPSRMSEAAKLQLGMF